MQKQVLADQNQGKAIGKMFKEKLFKVFQLLHNKSRFSGTSVGLLILKISKGARGSVLQDKSTYWQLSTY